MAKMTDGVLYRTVFGTHIWFKKHGESCVFTQDWTYQEWCATYDLSPPSPGRRFGNVSVEL